MQRLKLFYQNGLLLFEKKTEELKILAIQTYIYCL